MEDFCAVPYAFGYFNSYLKKYLPDKEIELKVIKHVQDLKEDSFDLIGITTYTSFYNDSLNLAKEIKKQYPDISICMGGYHISLLPHLLPKEVDFAIIGEGEETLKEVIETWFEYEGKNFKDKLKHGAAWDKIKGLVYFDESNNLKITEPRALLDINKIPFMDQEILKLASEEHRTIFSGRGCPYSCPFCCITKFWQKTRYFPVDYVINELESVLYKYPLAGKITFEDELFISNKKRLNELVELIEKKGFNLIADFTCNLRSNTIDEEMCRLLKRMNVKYALLGLESGNEEILKSLKPDTSLALNQNALELLYKYNIKTGGYFIVGTPGETEEALIDTFNFIIDNINNNKLYRAGVTILHPLPGTYYWEYAKKRGLVSDYMDWGKLANMALETIPGAKYQQWRSYKEGYSIYMNNDVMPEKKFYDLLGWYHSKIVPLMYAK